MVENLLARIKDKKIAILGFGIEGRSTYEYIRKHFSNLKLTIIDDKEDFDKEHTQLIKDPNIVCVYKDYIESLKGFDLIFKSPGISLKDVDTSGFEDKITSQIEFVIKYINVLTIGITGTKGKSTSSSLLYQILKEQGKDVYLTGNIGVPPFEYMDEFKKDTICVMEMSSHGLEYIKASPNISVLLNIFEEHLDFYKSINEYIKAKFNIFKFQTKDDFAIYNLDNEIMNQHHFKYIQHHIGITLENIELNAQTKTQEQYYLKENIVYHYTNKTGQEVYNGNEKRSLKGIHNLNDIMFVLAVCNILGLDIEKAKNTINEFCTLPHRMEYVGCINGVHYYNDSIATIPEATINCIEALEQVNTLIVGGMDRGVQLDGLIQYLLKSKIEHIICLPKTGEYIKQELERHKKQVFYANDLEEAVDRAKKVTKKDQICVLSPAASSYGYFKNFEERGKQFKKLVLLKS